MALPAVQDSMVWLETVVTLGRKDLLVQEVKLVIPVPRVSRDNSSLSGALLEKFLDVQVQKVRLALWAPLVQQVPQVRQAVQVFRDL